MTKLGFKGLMHLKALYLRYLNIHNLPVYVILPGVVLLYFGRHKIIITSGKEYMFLPVSMCSSIC